jgi:hypothetical protein
MNGIDIKNLAILTEALRGRSSHTQISDVFIFKKISDRRTIISPIYYSNVSEDPTIEDENGVEINNPDWAEDAPSPYETFGVIGIDPGSNRYFFTACDSMESVPLKKYYFNPKLSLDRIIEIGYRTGGLTLIRDEELAVNFNEVINAPGTKFLRFLHDTGIDVPDLGTLIEPV